MQKLTGIFKIHERFGEMVEIIKKLGNYQEIIPVHRKDIKIEKDGTIFVSEKIINEKSWFFRKLKNF